MSKRTDSGRVVSLFFFLFHLCGGGGGLSFSWDSDRKCDQWKDDARIASSPSLPLKLGCMRFVVWAWCVLAFFYVVCVCASKIAPPPSFTPSVSNYKSEAERKRPCEGRETQCSINSTDKKDLPRAGVFLLCWVHFSVCGVDFVYMKKKKKRTHKNKRTENDGENENKRKGGKKKRNPKPAETRVYRREDCRPKCLYVLFVCLCMRYCAACIPPIASHRNTSWSWSATRRTWRRSLTT